MSLLDSREHSFDSVISNSRFVIPDYQRYYSWEKKHFEDLWNDITGLIESNQEVHHTHYMGTIICKSVGSNREDLNEYDLVDGQQRLATLMILMRCLESEMEDEKAEEVSDYLRDQVSGEKRLKLQEQYLNDERVFDEIMEGAEIIETDAPSQRRLLEAREFYEQKVSGLEQRKLEKIFSEIISLEFMVYRIETDEKATLIFESINDRGKNLTRLEKTKSFLIHQIYLKTSKGEERDNRIKNVQSNFARLYSSIQKIKDIKDSEKLDEDSLQSLHFVSIAPKSLADEDREKIKESYLENLKTYIKNGESLDRVEDYLSDLSEFFDTYRGLLEEDRGDEWEQVVTGEASYMIPLLVRTKQKLEEETFEKFVDIMEAAVFRTHYREKRLNYGEKTYFELAHHFYMDKMDIEEVIDEVRDTARLQ